jgi:hypothetical protein
LERESFVSASAAANVAIEPVVMKAADAAGGATMSSARRMPSVRIVRAVNRSPEAAAPSRAGTDMKGREPQC